MSLQNIETTTEEHRYVHEYTPTDPLIDRVTFALGDLQEQKLIELEYLELIVSERDYLKKINEYVYLKSPRAIEKKTDSVIFTLQDNSQFAIGKRSNPEKGYIWHIVSKSEDTDRITNRMHCAGLSLKKLENVRTRDVFETIRENTIYGVDMKKVTNREKDFDIKNLPLTTYDPKDPKLALKQFIETTALLLDARNFTIRHNDNDIYTNNQTSSIEKKTRYLPPLEMIYYGHEFFAGIDMYLAMLNARLKYPLELEQMEIVSYEERNRPFIKHLRKEVQLHMISTSIDSNRQKRVILETQNHTPLIIKKELIDGRYGKGRIKWTIQVPTQYLESVKQIILHTSQARILEEDELGFVIKDVNPRSCVYLLEAKGI